MTDRLALAHEQQPPALQAGMLHGRYTMTDDPADLHETPLDYSTRMLPTVVERRCRVKVSGVVTPSPVGVAMLKLR